MTRRVAGTKYSDLACVVPVRVWGAQVFCEDVPLSTGHEALPVRSHIARSLTAVFQVMPDLAKRLAQ